MVNRVLSARNHVPSTGLQCTAIHEPSCQSCPSHQSTTAVEPQQTAEKTKREKFHTSRAAFHLALALSVVGRSDGYTRLTSRNQ
eukprot:7132082-Prymnesium_polylepis.2